MRTAPVLSARTATLSASRMTTTTTAASTASATVAVVPRARGPVGLRTVSGPMIGRSADVTRTLLTWPSALSAVHILGQSVGCDFGGAINGSSVGSNVSRRSASVTGVHGSWPATTIQHDPVPFLNRVADGAEGKVLLNHVRVGVGWRLEVGDLESFFESLSKAVHQELELIVRCTASLGKVVYHHHR